MKPCSRKAMPNGNLLQVAGAGSKGAIASIQGSVENLGNQYSSATIVLYSKENLQPIAVTKPDEKGYFQISGLWTSLKCFVVGLDNKHKFNAVIQDNVVPK